MRVSMEDAFRQYGDRVFSAAFSICRNREDADDVVQDTFLKYYARPIEFADEEHLKAWLLRVAINRAKDVSGAFWRRNRVSWESYMDELEFVQPEDRSLFEAVMCCRKNTALSFICSTTRTIPWKKSLPFCTAAAEP